MALLVITHPNGQEQLIPLDLEEVTVGRSKGLSVTLEGTNISRRHARFFREGDQYFVEDLGSSNGTFLNGQKIVGRQPFFPWDVIRLGAHQVRLDIEMAPQGDLTIHRQTAAAATNNELYRENAAQKLQAVLELAHELANTLDIEILLNRFVDQVLKLFPKADRVLIIFLNKEIPSVRLVRDRRRLPGGQKLFSQSLLKQVVEQGIAVLAEDAQALQANVTLNAMGVRSLLCVPLRAHGSAVFGVVQLDRFEAGNAFTSEDLNLLTAVTLQVSLVVEKARLHERLISQERIARELALAREIQLAFLPQKAPEIDGGAIDFFADLQPAEEVSGDFYDFMVLERSRLCVMIADVSGKGMPAAIFMSMVRVLLRQIVQAGAGPGETLTRLNKALAPDNPKFMFVTVLLGIYDAVTGKFVFARGGHPPPLLRKSDGALSEIESSPGCLIGIEDPCPVIEETSVTLQHGETIIFYTDGVTEAANKKTDELYGIERLKQSLQRMPVGSPLTEWFPTVKSDVDRFCGDNGPQDDITLLFLRRVPNAADPERESKARSA